MTLYYYKDKVYSEFELSQVYDKTNKYYTHYGPNWFII